MRWREGRRSNNIEDRRGQSSRCSPGRGRTSGKPGLKLGGGAGILVLLLGMFPAVDLSGLMGTNGGSATSGMQQLDYQSNTNVRGQDEETAFVSATLAYNEDVWTTLFAQSNQQYRPAKLVIFDGGVNSACGYTSSAAGPFYCPGDYQIYIDLNFFRKLQKMGAGGDFAQAYVLAQEVGHHIQNLLGVSIAVQKRQRAVGKADCYTGVWAHHAHKDSQPLEAGDLEEDMNAAAKIGDDALMKQAGAQVRPEAFTHGSSKQRQEWLYRSLESGDPQQCDSFAS
ncbi:MAG: putative metalloprotease [bacterium]|jgi:predicted metalloprotease